MSSVKIAHSGDSELRLRHAVLLYRATDNSAVYATLHDVNCEQAGAPQLLAGRPMTLQELAMFVDAAAARTAYRGFVDSALLYVASNTVAWWVPPARRRIWFRSTAPIGEASAETAQPGLIFVAHGKQWHVFAVRGDERPGPATPLYRAPYFNVWESGQICVGNVSIPEQPGPDAIAAYNAAFFRSHFTHSNYHGKPAVRHKGGITQLWVDLLAGADFPQACLTARKETLAEAIARIAKGD